MQEIDGRLADSAAGRIFALDEAAVREAAGELAEAVESHGLPTVLADVGAPLTAFLAAAFTLSPFLHDTFRSRPDLLGGIDQPILPQIEAEIEKARAAWIAEGGSQGDGEIMARLRHAKQRVAAQVRAERPPVLCRCYR